MQSVDLEVLGQLAVWLADKKTCWLGTVVSTWGSSPRQAGSLFACNERGDMVGSLSGGCVEDDLLEQLQRGELASDNPVVHHYGLTADDTEKFGLPCGGELQVVLEPIKATPDEQQRYNQIAEDLRHRRNVRRTIDIPANGSPTASSCRVESVTLDRSQDATEDQASSDFSFDMTSDGAARLSQIYGPRYQLFLVGANMVAHYVAQFAQTLDYEITVCDPREHLLEAFSAPGVHKVCMFPDDAVRKHASDVRSAIITLTHDPRIDDMALMQALKTDAFYVGAMGSTRTSAARRERLLELEVTAAELTHLHGPVGLSIGSKTPPEIALAVVAELVEVRSKMRKAAAQTTPQPGSRQNVA